MTQSEKAENICVQTCRQAYEICSDLILRTGKQICVHRILWYIRSQISASNRPYYETYDHTIRTTWCLGTALLIKSYQYPWSMTRCDRSTSVVLLHLEWYSGSLVVTAFTTHKTMFGIETTRWLGKLLRLQTSISSVRTIDPKTFKGCLLTLLNLFPTRRWKSSNRKEGAVISAQVTPATFHLHRLSQGFLRQDCPVFSWKRSLSCG